MKMGEASLDGRRILVVGASAGIGRAVGQAAVRDGASVVFAARRAEQLAAAIAEAGGGHGVTADVRVPGDCTRMVQETVAALGGIDVVVYATAVSPLRRLRDSDTDTWAQVLETNLVGVNEVARAALPHLSEDAVVAVLSSDSVGVPRPGLVPYAASKAALEETLRGWRVEHPEVRWMCITVGPTIPTEFGLHFDPELVGELFADWARLGMNHSAMMETTDVANMIVGTLALVGAHPGIGCEQIVLRPAAGIVEGADQIQAAFDQMQAQK